MQTTSTLTVRPIHGTDDEQWDRFVTAHPYGTPFHLSAWRRSMEETWRYEPKYLAAVEGDTVRGVLPLFYCSNPLIGKALISSPFAVYGGILADNPEAHRALAEEARRAGEALGVDYVELRNAYPEQRCGFEPVNRYLTFTAEATITEEEALLAALPKKTRNMVRKALKFPYSTRTQKADFQKFQDLYSKNLRRLGTPSFPDRHFANLLKHFGDMIDIREILLGDKVVAASFNIYFRDSMHTYYAASDQDFLAQAPNNYLYFDHLLHSARTGHTTFDFGRCKRDSGTLEFKKHWNTTMRELPYEVLLVRRREMPSYNPSNPKFKLAISTWRKLPLPLTRFLGPFWVRLVP